MVWNPRQSARERTSFGDFQLHESHLITGGRGRVEMDISRHVRYDARTDDTKDTDGVVDRQPGRSAALVIIGQGIEAGADRDEILDVLDMVGFDLP
jgi:hypothetical protein